MNVKGRSIDESEREKEKDKMIAKVQCGRKESKIARLPA
jgi:hypothetical protein